MKENPLHKLEAFGQSIWLDFIRRGMLVSGELAQLIEQDGLGGVTSNPAIFEKAIAKTDDYDDAIRALAEHSAEEIYTRLTIEDIQHTADLFRPVHEKTDGRDGFVSLEVSPQLARDTAATLTEARRLWQEVARPNVMIKVPGTREGIPAIRQLVSEGLNINVTLLFGLPRYREVAEAFLAGLEERAAENRPLKGVASVASFFLSRIDVLVDPFLEKIMQEKGPAAALAAELRGEVAISSAKAAYQIYLELFNGERFRRLAAKGASSQRLLWASTGTKNPEYSDIKYVEALIGPETVNTLPMETLAAYRDHGRPEARLTEGGMEARRLLERLSEVGVDLDAITRQLEEEGVEKFIASFDNLIKSLESKRLKGTVEQTS
ncbi:MAG: transaldolase [Desulfobulbaceae bacterium]